MNGTHRIHVCTVLLPSQPQSSIYIIPPRARHFYPNQFNLPVVMTLHLLLLFSPTQTIDIPLFFFIQKGIVDFIHRLYPLLLPF